jgi:hypothetical protein
MTYEKGRLLSYFIVGLQLWVTTSRFSNVWKEAVLAKNQSKIDTPQS